MGTLGLISIAIIIANVIVSYRGFSSHEFFARYSFEVEKILIYKDYKRLVTSGFLHVNWMHLIFNMFSLYIFSAGLESYIGSIYYLVIYFISLIGGNLFSLYIHRRHEAYSAVGASGAVCGIMFASIALFPDMRIGLFFLPISFPAWMYGLAFVLYTIYGIKSRRDNVGYETHLGGALIGLLAAIAIQPSALIYNYIPILLIVIPSAIFIYFIIKNPAFLLINNTFKRKYTHTVEDRYNASKRNEEEEIDRILEKIHKRGMSSLTKEEKEKLKAFSESQ
ncbi:MAG TPA: rhomboid family intramembrane serine protease [Chitinophagaceae bacterium]|nr:rhomboid family intramembrane serine protease [Chitinophagaceae bacterium]